MCVCACDIAVMGFDRASLRVISTFQRFIIITVRASLLDFRACGDGYNFTRELRIVAVSTHHRHIRLFCVFVHVLADVHFGQVVSFLFW